MISNEEKELSTAIGEWAHQLRDLAEALSEGQEWYKYHHIAVAKGTRFAIGYVARLIERDIKLLADAREDE